MNKQISYYSQKNLEIRKTESMGMGLFSNDNIEKDQIIVKFDKRKII